MTWKESLDFLKKIYQKFMFENKWTLQQIDEMDSHFLFEILEVGEKKEEVYLSDVW